MEISKKIFVNEDLRLIEGVEMERIYLDHAVTTPSTQIEHHGVLHTCKKLEKVT